MNELIAYYNLSNGDEYDIVRDMNGKYFIRKNEEEIVQSNRDDEGIIRYLANALHNSEYMRKKQNE